MALEAQRQPWRTAGAGRRAAASAGLILAVTLGCTPAAVDEDPPPAPREEAADLSVAAEAAPTPRQTPEPLLTARADEQSLVGDLVADFPIDLLPVPNDSLILVTSAVPVGDANVQQVSLNLRTSARASDLLELYRTALTAAGFTEVPNTSESDLAVEATFVRSGGDELISIGVLDVDGARTVTIGGRVHTQD